MIDVDYADMCSNQRGLRRKISRAGNGVGANVTLAVVENLTVDLVSQMKRL